LYGNGIKSSGPSRGTQKEPNLEKPSGQLPPVNGCVNGCARAGDSRAATIPNTSDMEAVISRDWLTGHAPRIASPPRRNLSGQPLGSQPRL
jgi:hypothetical protein